MSRLLIEAYPWPCITYSLATASVLANGAFHSGIEMQRRYRTMTIPHWLWIYTPDVSISVKPRGKGNAFDKVADDLVPLGKVRTGEMTEIFSAEN